MPAQAGMEVNMDVQKIVEATKNIYNVYIGSGTFDNWECTYKSPVTEDEIKKFEKEVAVIPADYKEFLTTTNGIIFFNSGDFTFFSLQEVTETQKIMDFKNGIYPIGYVLDDYIVIKSDEISTGCYIYAGDACCRDEYFSLNCDFATFLDRYVMANASNYWRWFMPGKRFDFMN